MPDVKAIEDAVKALPARDLAEFRRWFAEFEFAVWDDRIETDSASGRMERLLDEAEEDYRLGEHREL